MRPTRPGDVIALPTNKGLALAQVVSKDKLYGTLIRVLEPLFSEPPLDLQRAVGSETRFYTIFPVNAAVHRGIVSRLGNAVIPEGARRFPLLRQRGRVKRNGSVADWWLWTEPRLGESDH